MGNADMSTFRVNDDGSVTMANPLSEKEKNILEIFRIEKSKGGALASRRMKKRALAYAKSVGIPEIKVEQLMLDNYPAEFENYPRTTKLLTWLWAGLLLLLGASLLVIVGYADEGEVFFHFRREASREGALCKELVMAYDSGDLKRAQELLGYGHKAYQFSREELNDKIQERWNNVLYYEEIKKNYFYRMCWYLAGAVACLGMAIFCMTRFRRTRREILLATGGKKC